MPTEPHIPAPRGPADPATGSTVTRRPAAAGYTTLGSPQEPGEDYVLLVDGVEIGGTFWYGAAPVGKHWASWGPGGPSRGHYSRQVAEQVQLDAHRRALAVTA